MSLVRATQTFHHSAGTVTGGTEYKATDPVVKAFPGFFEPVADEPAPKKRGPGRPRGTRLSPGQQDG